VRTAARKLRDVGEGGCGEVLGGLGGREHAIVHACADSGSTRSMRPRQPGIAQIAICWRWRRMTCGAGDAADLRSIHCGRPELRWPGIADESPAGLRLFGPSNARRARASKSSPSSSACATGSRLPRRRSWPAAPKRRGARRQASAGHEGRRLAAGKGVSSCATSELESRSTLLHQPALRGCRGRVLVEEYLEGTRCVHGDQRRTNLVRCHSTTTSAPGR